MIDRHVPIRCIALTDRNAASLSRSASGGVFAVLAREVLGRGGVVFGAELGSDGRVRHVAIERETDLPRIQGSKYVWGNMGDSVQPCINYLRAGREVLFSGLPCQVYRLRAAVEAARLSKVQRDLLITCDLICHGTPSPELFRAHQDWLAERVGAEDGIHDYRFRSKRYGWGLVYSYTYRKRGRLRTVYGESGDDPYYRAFLRGITYRSGCYRCPFACPERVGDITLGDYWGVEKRQPGAYDPQGVSAVLLNTERGLRFFESRIASAEECVWCDASFDDIAAQNANLLHPTVRSKGDALLAREIEGSLSVGDRRRVFEELLSVDKGLKAHIRRALPLPAIRLLRLARSRFQSADPRDR